MILPPKPFPPRFCSCTVHLVISADFKTVCSNIYKFCGLFTLPFFTFLPIVAIELTENQCQSVYASWKGYGCELELRLESVLTSLL